MAINSDFRDLFCALNDADAKYLVIGGYAVSFHGQPRFTKDLDIWVSSEANNARLVYEALRAFGAPMRDLEPNELMRPDVIFQIGVEPIRIDVMTSVDGVTFEEAWPEREIRDYADQQVPVISRRHLIQNKRASGRPQDLLDVSILERSERDP